MARIKEVTDGHILFYDGTEITYYHEQYCCEWNYADFQQLEEAAFSEDFDTNNLRYEFVAESGFRFGSNSMRMYFIPCYSEQNSFYGTDIEIYQNGELVLAGDCEWVEPIGTVPSGDVFINGKWWFYLKFRSGNGMLEAVRLYDSVSWGFIKEFQTFEEMIEYIKNR